jgi:transaldolase
MGIATVPVASRSVSEPVIDLKSLKVKLFADGADKDRMLARYQDQHIAGFTTNPTLMRKAGIADYGSFARDLLTHIKDRPISLEVFADDFAEMEKQARIISAWGENVYVKIPVTTTAGEPTLLLVEDLSNDGIKLNVTAVFTVEQVERIVSVLAPGVPAYVSIFAGRIADTGRDPIPIMSAACEILSSLPDVELIWASPREVLNVIQADQIGCHIITATDDILKKLGTLGKDLTDFSIETVKMFYDDAKASGYQIS